jgi:hypothetical protein
LAVGRTLRPDADLNRSAPSKVYAYPTPNAYATEDLEVWSGPTLGRGLHVTAARLLVHYAVDQPTVDPFRNATDPTRTRHFVFWIGSDGVFPTYETAWGPAALTPGTRYTATVDLPLPAGGWNIPAGERLQLLVAPLMVNTGSNVHYLVEHGTTPSRMELEATPWDAPQLGALDREETQHVLVANGGMFTGVGPASASTLHLPLRIHADDAYLRVHIQFVSNAAGKSDLDLWVEDAAGQEVASSTTPYQSETVRLWGPQLESLGGGVYTLRIVAYSGLQTHLRVTVERGSPTA